MFVYDLLIFSKADLLELEHLMGLLKKNESLSCQTINLRKSDGHLPPHLHGPARNTILKSLKMIAMANGCKYLDMPLFMVHVYV